MLASLAIYLLAFYPVVATGLFLVMPTPRRAIIAVFLLGFLFLPPTSIDIQGFIDFNKHVVICLSVLPGILLFDLRRVFLNFRFHWLDLFLVSWTLSPIFTVRFNGLPDQLALSQMAIRTIEWGIPLFLGRIYFRTLEDYRDLAYGLVYAGLVYTPFCLWESRMSPSLNQNIYGFNMFGGAGMAMAIRFGGYRPFVFTLQGIMLSLFMCQAALIAATLWRTKAIRSWRLPLNLRVGAGLVAMGLIAVGLLCRTLGAIMLLMMSLSMMWLAYQYRWRWHLIVLILLVPTYMVSRSVELLTIDQVDQIIRPILPTDRVESFIYRLQQEEDLTSHAMARPFFGWGGYGRDRGFDPTGINKNTLVKQGVIDSLWLTLFTQNGGVTLVSHYVLFLTPSLLALLAMPPSKYRSPLALIVPLMSLVVINRAVDTLFNGFRHSYYYLIVGGTLGILPGLNALKKEGYVSLPQDPRTPGNLPATGLLPTHQHQRPAGGLPWRPRPPQPILEAQPVSTTPLWDGSEANSASGDPSHAHSEAPSAGSDRLAP